VPDASPYDALLLVSFGGPEKSDDVLPFLEKVTGGRGVPPERLAEVAEHYERVGGRSPINDLNRALLAAIEADLADASVELPVYWGNRNWDPLLADAARQMAADGVRRAAVFVTSAYASYSGCRQYRESLYTAFGELPGAPRLDKLRHYFDHPGFVEPVVDGVLAALADLPPDVRAGAHLAFVTHSIPTSMAETSGPPDAGGAYVAQHLDVAATVARRLADETGIERPYELVYCSRSGPPSIPWLEPDVNDHLEKLAAGGTTAVVLVPIGFVSDHMEVVFDLDTEAAATAERVGLPMRRAATSGSDPRFVRMVRDLVLERAAAERGEPVTRDYVGSTGPLWDRCPVGCCANPRGEVPALCGEGDR